MPGHVKSREDGGRSRPPGVRGVVLRVPGGVPARG